MTKLTCFSGYRRNRASWASAPRSRSGASVRSQSPSERSSRLPASDLTRISASTPLVPDLDDVVERVALDGDLARVADHAEDLLLGEARRALGEGCVGDLLVLQRAVDVGGAEVERDRRGLLADHDPVGFDVREVVEHEPRGRDRAEVIDGRRLARHELRGADLIGEGDEGEEAAAPVLLLAQPQEMLDPLRHGLDVAVEHG